MFSNLLMSEWEQLYCNVDHEYYFEAKKELNRVVMFDNEPAL